MTSRVQVKRKLLVCEGLTLRWLVVLEDGKPLRQWLYEKDQPSASGSLVLARITDVSEKLKALFLDLGPLGEGFARMVGADTGWRSGQTLLVQVVAHPGGDKRWQCRLDPKLRGAVCFFEPMGRGVKLSRRLREKGEGVLNVEGEPWSIGGWLLRQRAANWPEDRLRHEGDSLVQRWQEAQSALKAGGPCRLIDEQDADPLREWLLDEVINEGADCLFESESLFDDWRERFRREYPECLPQLKWAAQEPDLLEVFQLNAALSQLRHRKIWLKSGAAMTVEKTEAAWVIDINSAKASKSNKTIAKINEEAIDEVARQIVWRALTGMILVDLIGQGDEVNPLADRLHRQLAPQSGWVRTDCLPSMGLIALARQRQDEDVESQSVTCTGCGGPFRLDFRLGVLWPLDRRLWRRNQDAPLPEQVQVVIAPSVKEQLSSWHRLAESRLPFSLKLQVSREQRMDFISLVPEVF